jgi:glycosyltransferase involved in cell wall biosynthesis
MGLRSRRSHYSVSLLSFVVKEVPFFSVILPTYGRGRHIRPSIESVLAQTFRDFELLVVGDGCVDETESVVRSFRSEKIRWTNLPQNSGSQSVPNNEGIRLSRGCWIAYIGHDDIWAPSHLDRIFQKTATSDPLDFIVSGCVFYGPEGSDDYYITGLFEEPDAPSRHFFPPTSIAHRRDVASRMGGWRDPHEVQCPADNEFLMRAVQSRMRFVSTGEITVHKFAAGHRYLSYLRPSCDEQSQLLTRLMSQEGADIERIVLKSKANGQYMLFQYGDYSEYANGYLFEQNLKRKGISRPALRPLVGSQVIEQTEEPRGLDWHDIEFDGRKYRWSGPNPRPKILIPFTGLSARISIAVIFKNPYFRLEDTLLYVENKRIRFKIRDESNGISYVNAYIPLRKADYTVLTLHAPTFRRKDMSRNEDGRKIGLAIGDITLESHKPRLRTWWHLHSILN